MIDRRSIKNKTYEVEKDLKNLDDSSILLNFKEVLTKIYPNLIKVIAHAYDSWDNISENLFNELVYNTFAWKYGIQIDFKNIVVYESSNPSVSHFHIQCFPKKKLSKIYKFNEEKQINFDDYKNVVLIFDCFMDGINYLSSGISVDKAKNVNFDMVHVSLVDIIKDKVLDNFFMHYQDVDYQFVAVD
ncbi:hypothetical protein KHQ81_00300 [Mycoplasmatota bacterium]|nr:hypothetical protein KHQ81_00300 [Mycoplasmatota bacterium]